MPDPCCDLAEVHYHCPECMQVTGMYGHAVGDRVICDPAERRAYRRSVDAVNGDQSVPDA